MSNNRLEITIRTRDFEEQRMIGEHICNQLRGNKDFIDSNIVVNYTDNDDSVYIIVGEESKPTEIKLQL